MSYLNEKNDINIEKGYPISDEEGASLTPYKFEIHNNCDKEAIYDVNVEVLYTTTLDSKYVKVKLNDQISLLSNKEDITPTLNSSSKAYKIMSDVISANGSNKYSLNIWMDYDAPPTSDTMNKIFDIKVSVTSTYKKVTASEYIMALGSKDTTNLAIDDYGNTRYIGKNPNNYVSIDGELWRIIGVMKDIDDGTGIKEDRIKLIRAESIGGYSWDTSDSSVNSGYGVNEWSQADLMKLLNPGYESESVGGSLYWNSKSGNCYNGQNNATTSCDFTNNGMKDTLKNLIDNAVWNTGSNDGAIYIHTNVLTSKFYELERSKNIGKICSSGTYCNDDLERTTTWIGKVGLMYPSDYGYATSDGNTTNREICLNTFLHSWDNKNIDCRTNSFFYTWSRWTIMPFASTSKSSDAFATGGRVSNDSAYHPYGVFPAVYLKSSVKIVSGDGSSSNLFTLSL